MNKTLLCYVAVVTEPPAKTAATMGMALLASGGGLVMLSFYGYDDDPRPLHQIPEVRAWCRGFIEAGGLDYMPAFGDGPPDMEGQILKDYTLLAFAGMPGASIDAQCRMHLDKQTVAAQRKKYSKAS